MKYRCMALWHYENWGCMQIKCNSQFASCWNCATPKLSRLLGNSVGVTINLSNEHSSFRLGPWLSKSRSQEKLSRSLAAGIYKKPQSTGKSNILTMHNMHFLGYQLSWLFHDAPGTKYRTSMAFFLTSSVKFSAITAKLSQSNTS